MAFLEEIAQKRQSCRRYDPAGVVDEERLARCLKAARLAPSACNAQPYRFTVAKGEVASQVGALTRSMGMNAFTADVPVFVVVSEGAYTPSARAGASLKKQDYRSVDIGIAAAYFTAEAQSQGLATCILGWFDEKGLCALLGLEERVRLVLAVGLARKDDPLREKKRRSLEELVTFKGEK